MQHRIQGQPSLTVALVAALAFVGVIVSMADAAAADTAEFQTSFSVPAGPLNEALGQLAAETGVSITTAPELVDGVKTQGVKGRYAVSEALALLLAGTGLQAVDQGGGAYALSRLPVVTGDATMMPAVKVTAEVETATGPVSGYAASRQIGATKTDSARLETPQAVTVITRDQMTDQGSVGVRDALRYTAGVVPGTVAFGGDDVRVRGFTNGGRLIQDGLLRGFSIGPEPYGLERIELLRGPASVLYGLSEPGGLVTAVSKRPTEQRLFDVGAGIGTDDFKEVTADLSGKLGASPAVLGRLSAVYRDGNNPLQYDVLDGKRDERMYLAPALTWRPSDKSELIVFTSYQRDDTKVIDGGGLPARGTVLPNINGRLRRGFFTGEPDFNSNQTEIYRAGWNLQYQLDDSITLRQNSGYFLGDAFLTNVQGSSLQADQRTLNRLPAKTDQQNSQWEADTSIEWKFSTGDVSHTVLGGFDMVDRHDELGFLFAPNSTIDIFDPVYGADLGTFAPAVDQLVRVRQYGFYLQEQARLTPRLTLTLGGRFDSAESSTLNRLSGVEVKPTDDAFSPRLGATYQLVDGVAAYASYSESFLPVTGVRRDGGILEPETGEQNEIGIKAETSDGALVGTLSAFDTKRQNISVADGTFRLQTGEQHHRGIELDVTGRPLPNLSLITTYAYTDAEITADTDTALVGSRPANVPKHQASLWSVYDFHNEPLTGIRFGGGLRYVGSRNADASAASFSMPDFTVVDAFASYRYNGGYRFDLQVRNLFDKDYFVHSVGGNSLYYGEPLTVIGRITKSF